MKNKIISIVLSIIIIIGGIPFASTYAMENTALNDPQIEYEGGWTPSNYEIDGILHDDKVAISKTVTPTADENYFDIILKVVAKEQQRDQSVDIVVVMDVSNTMNYTHDHIGPGAAGYDPNYSRLNDSKNAINSFIDQFSTNTKISEERRFSLVTFNSHANVVIPMTKINTTETATDLKKKVNAIIASGDIDKKFTNIEGGLQLAQNILATSKSKYKYIIFLTDGFPTTYIESNRTSTETIYGYDTYETESYSASKLNKDGFFADSITKKVCSYGVDYSDKAADRADDVASNIKKSGINIFSIGLDVGAQTISGYIDKFKNSNFTTVDRRSTTYVIGDTKESYIAWLRDSIAGGPQLESLDEHRYSSGDDSTTLTAAFTNILKDIELVPVMTMREAYTVDPMSDAVEFLHFYDTAGNPTNALVNANGAEVASFDSETEMINWLLMNTPFTKDEHGNFLFNISYKVRLKNEVAGFIPSTPLLTNDTTTFNFKTVDEDGNPLYGDNHLNYKIPQVEGYFGNLTFTKRDAETGEAIQGAEFTLRHYGNSCQVCNGDAVIADAVATSAENGIVEFYDMPSGHEYALIETVTPEGYQKGAMHSVSIEYGITYLDGTELTQNNLGEVTNQKIKPVEAELTAHKSLNGRNLENEEFTFVLKGVGVNNVIFHEKVTNDADGNVVFDPIIFDKVGTYNFTVSEEIGTDESIIYDTTVYDVEFTVGINSTGDEYTLTTKINGQDIDNDTAPNAFSFNNTVKGDAVAVLKATKTMDGEIPDDGVFEFELLDKNGNLLQTVTNLGGNISFEPINYKKSGTYIYTIREKHGDDYVIYYDHSVYTAEVIVTAPEGGTDFEASVNYYKNNEAVESVVFNNKTRADATLLITADKLFDGKLPENEQFSFELCAEDGTVIETVTNDADGKIKFSELNFNEPDFKIYKINEVKGTEETIIYDKLIYTIYVQVEAVHNNDTYFIQTAVVKGDEVVSEGYGTHLELNSIGFNNSIRKDAIVELNAEKILDGKAPDTEVFSFKLKNDQGEVIQTVNNNGGYITFEPLSFNKSGVYNYTIEEAKGSEANIVYDETVYDVVITVTAPDDSDEFTANVEYYESGEAIDAVLFNNYHKGSVEITKKGVSGTPITDTVKFKLYTTDKDGGELIAEIGEKTVDSEGKVKFENLDIFTDDTYGEIQWYCFVETIAKEGYNINNTKYYFTLPVSQKLENQDSTDFDFITDEVKYEFVLKDNKPIYDLEVDVDNYAVVTPETSGSGTRAYMIFGTGLIGIGIMLAIAYKLRRKRKIHIINLV